MNKINRLQNILRLKNNRNRNVTVTRLGLSASLRFAVARAIYPLYRRGDIANRNGVRLNRKILGDKNT